MKRILSILAVATVLVSCNKFGDTNVSPTQLSAPSTRALLTYSQQQLSDLMFGNTAAARLGSMYVQFLSEGPYPGPSLYSDKNPTFTTFYVNPLANLQAIINYNTAGSPLAEPGANGAAANQIAVARIMKAYYFLQMTDRWGDIPYSEALKGAEAFTPKYDKQQDIYTSLFKELKEANDQIKTGEAGVAGDVILGGSMAGWKRFANTTRMIMALRLSQVDAAKGKTEYAAAVTDGVLTEVGQGISYKFIGGDPNNYNPWYNNYSVSFRNDYAISNTLADYMAPKNDARLPVYGEVLSGNVVKGLTYGKQGAVNIPGAFSRIGTAFRAAGSPLNIYSYSQVLFMRAEAAKIGYTTGGDAEAMLYYTNAITASFAENGVAGGAAAYLAQVPYSPATGWQQIMTEKWVSMYLKGWESWNDWRRTGFPALVAAPDAVDSRGIPTRQGYPTAELSLNKDNYNAAIASMGGDHNYIKLWWDK
jgi:hypothetical protein